MRNATVWQQLLGVESTVVEGVVFDGDEGVIVASVRPRKTSTRCCGRCGRRCAWEDRGEGRRRWRTLDLGSIPAYLEADAPRVHCPEHGVVVVAFPWARHRARHSSMFEDQCAWLAAHCSRSAVEELMGVAWRTVGAIVGRVVIWAAPGRDKKTLATFFDALGKSRSARLREVSADGAEWIAAVVHSRCLNARLVMDAFHTVQVRREAPCVRRRVRDPPLRAVAAAW